MSAKPRRDFQTCGEPDLERMAAEANAIEHDIADGIKPRWLTFVGSSGTGKTMLARQIFGYARGMLSEHASLINPVLWIFWPDLLSQLRDGEYWRMRDLSDANFVAIDDVVVEHDPSGFARDKLCELLSRRCGKWTVITSNLSIPALHAIDGRIASRLVRGGSVVVEVNCKDFALR